MKLHILTQKITDFNFKTGCSSDEQHINLSYQTEYPTNAKNTFTLIFNISIAHPNEFELNCVYATTFKTSEEITEEFKNADFPKINAPAIAFPFLRVLISNFTLNAGYSPIVLPTLNFVELHNNKK